MSLIWHACEALSSGWTLAQAPAAPQALRKIYLWLGVLLLLTLALVVAAVILRRVLMRSDSGGQAQGFTLHDLRRMHQQGLISEQEYQAARTAMLARGLAQAPDRPDAARDLPKSSPDTPQQPNSDPPDSDKSGGGPESDADA